MDFQIQQGFSIPVASVWGVARWKTLSDTTASCASRPWQDYAILDTMQGLIGISVDCNETGHSSTLSRVCLGKTSLEAALDKPLDGTDVAESRGKHSHADTVRPRLARTNGQLVGQAQERPPGPID